MKAVNGDVDVRIRDLNENEVKKYVKAVNGLAIYKNVSIGDLPTLNHFEEGIRHETREIIVRRNLLSEDVIGDFLDEIVSNIGDYVSLKPDVDNDELYLDFRDILRSEVRSAVRNVW